MKKSNLLLFLLFAVLTLLGFQSFSQSFTLPGDGKWYLVATVGGRHAYLEYIYDQTTAHNPSISKGEIQFINAKSFVIQEHQTMGYNAANQPQFALINKGNTSELWIKATEGISPGVFEVIYAKHAALILGTSSDTDLSDNGGSLKIYNKLTDNSHAFSGNLTVIDGNIGIGTTTPTTKFHVEAESGTSVGLSLGDAKNEGKYLLFRNNIGGTNEIRSYGLNLEIETRNTQDILFNNNNGATNLMTIKGTGNIGVGTTSPDAKLTVKGVIHAEEVKVDLNVPGPDYVFEESYPLLSLEETQAYIKENKHLPGIPSSAEMHQNGVNLLEINMKLLEKVEELTLHLIDQQKKIDAQNKAMELQLLAIESLRGKVDKMTASK